MKRNFVIGGMIFLIGGLGLQPSVTSVKAETSLAAKQVINQPKKTLLAVNNNQIQVELLNSGNGNKQQLRFRPPVNFKQTSIMNMKMDMQMLIGGKALPSIKQPATVATIQTKVTKIDPNGDIHFDFTYSDIDLVGNTNLPPQVLQKLRSQIQKLRGMKGSGIVDNRGNMKKTNLVIPKGLDASLKQIMQQMTNSLDQFSSPLPQQAVGKGSQWRVTSKLNLGGMKFKQISTYQLVNLKEGVATLKIGVEQVAPSQNLTTPGLPQGVTLNLKSYKGTGQGKAIMALNQLMPMSTTMSLVSNTEMTQKAKGSPEETRMNQKISMSMVMESK